MPPKRIAVKRYVTLCVATLLTSCGIYNFTGGNTGEAKTFQVEFFQNKAPIVEPGMDRDFTNFLADQINNQTNLSLTNKNADLVYEGEIVDYNISPMSATSDQKAAQNRLTVKINVRFSNAKDENKDFERTFTHYYDFPANTQVSAIKNTALEEIFERIAQDIFNASLANW